MKKKNQYILFIVLLALYEKDNVTLSEIGQKTFFDSGFAKDFESSILDELCKAINPSMTQMAGETTLMKIVRMGHEKAKNIDIAQRHPIYTDEQKKQKT